MPTLYLTKTELAEGRRALQDAGITDPRAEAQMIRDFGEGKFTLETVDSYCVLLADTLTAKPEAGGSEIPFEHKPKDKNPSNPYNDAFLKTHTVAQQHAEIARLTRVMGSKAVAALAKAQNKDLAGRKLASRAA